jgi:outer membrane protein assembly factor BamD (BamD/ComL family)
MRKFTVKRFFALFVAAALLVSACASAVNIPGDLSPAELIQRAQEASDRNRYKIALQYYQALLERNSARLDMVCTAEYEIGFIHYKQKKYAEARGEMNALLERYNSPDAELLPQQFKRLATIVLDRITEKEKPRFPFTLFQKKTTAAE